MYDYLVTGSGIFGSVFAHEITKFNKSCLVIDKRNHIGGNAYTKNIEGINVSCYGPHIFHTNNKHVWDYINKFANFNNFINSPKVYYKGKVYSFPINMMTFHQLWGVVTPQEAEEKLQKVKIPCKNPKNIKDYALANWGEEIYSIFIEQYTKKQWNRDPKDLPASIIKRLPVRLTYKENHYYDSYQGMPIGGYTQIFDKLLDGIDVTLNTNFKDIGDWRSIGKKLIFTGSIDEFFDYKYGELEYRSLRFEEEILDGDFQGTAVMNYTDINVPYTRIVEHKHFEEIQSKKTVITKEYPDNWSREKEAYYPIGDEKNNKIYNKYKKEIPNDVIISGRLGSYKYLDLDTTISMALQLVKDELFIN